MANRIFGNFLDFGYAFSKTIGIILISYSALLLGTLKILPFTKEGLIILFSIFIFLIFKFFKKEIKSIFQLKAKTLVILLLTELLFLFALISLAFVRGQEGSIRGLEKFMDFGFMQAINKSTYFPPLDMWYGPDDLKPEGYYINYYYFGHLTGALLIKLHGVLPAIGYNLVLATIFAQAISMTFSLTSSFVHLLRQSIKKTPKISAIPSLIFGLIGAFLLNLGGNLHTIYIFTTGYKNEEPIAFWKIMQPLYTVLNTMETTGKNFFDAVVANSSYWYPNATRFIPNTIHEFPSYSYVVADLHGHVFDIPFVILLISLIFVFFVSQISVKADKSTSIFHFFKKLRQVLSEKNSLKKKFFSLLHKNFPSKREVFFASLFGALISINYMTNAFDGPIYLLLTTFVFLYLYKLSINFIFQTFILFLSFIVVSLPFSLFFEPFSSAIGVNCAPLFLTEIGKIGPFIFEKGNCQSSPVYMLFVLWGFFAIMGAALFVTNKVSRLGIKNNWSSYDRFAMLLFLFSFFLIIVPEFLYAKDIYPGHFRANTMFKMGYQAFIMMSIATVISLYRVFKITNFKWRILLKLVTITPLFLVLIYPYMAFPSYYPGLLDGTAFGKNPVLDGSKWLENGFKAQNEIIKYLNTKVSGQPVILEAQGDSYTDYNVISAYTGFPTVAGWWVHQWLWRGSADVVGKRIPDINALYTSPDLVLTRELIKKYQIDYVVITNQEREKYKSLNEEKFEKLGNKVFQSSDGFGALYKVY
jgi:YYY domain-containing protein